MTKQEREKKLKTKLEQLKAFDIQAINIFLKDNPDKQEARIIGIDEAGRGPLAGPVVACGVIMPTESMILGVRDSKKTTEKQRLELYDKIMEEALEIQIEIVESDEIDELNILGATKKATENIVYKLKDKAEIVFFDALTGLNSHGLKDLSIIKGDDTSYSIACASIIAKVTRDNIMLEYSKVYPEYAFDKHKGYGTKLHYEAIKDYGVLDIHRKSFLKNLSEH